MIENICFERHSEIWGPNKQKKKKTQQVSWRLVIMAFSVTFSLVLLLNKWLHPPCLLSAEASCLCWHLYSSDCCVWAITHPIQSPCTHAGRSLLTRLCMQIHTPEFPFEKSGRRLFWSRAEYFLQTDTGTGTGTGTGQDNWPVLSSNETDTLSKRGELWPLFCQLFVWR